LVVYYKLLITFYVIAVIVIISRYYEKMPINKFSTYAFTFRPRGGVTDAHIASLVKYIKKVGTYYFIITEKLDDERHVHSAFLLKKPTYRSCLSVSLGRLFKDLDKDEIRVMYKGLKILYSDDFLKEYMNKGDHTVVIERNLPENGSLCSYYPSKDPPPPTGRSYQLHTEMKRLESLWNEYVPPHVEKTTPHARDFLFRMMYTERVHGIVCDDKVRQLARHLVRWMNKPLYCKLECPPFEKEEGPGYC